MKFALIAVTLVLFVFIFHSLFVLFDYGFNNPDSGAFTMLEEKLEDRMPMSYRNKNDELIQFFGVGRFVVLAVALACFALEIIDRKRVVSE